MSSDYTPTACLYCGRFFLKVGIPEHEKVCAASTGGIPMQHSATAKAAKPQRTLRTHQERRAENSYILDTIKQAEQPKPRASKKRKQPDSRLIDPKRVAPNDYRAGDFRTVYHPWSNRNEVVVRFEDYQAEEGPQVKVALDERPWRPFPSRKAFELADYCLDACLNHDEISRLLRLMEECDPDISSWEDFRAMWSRASLLRTPFQKTTFNVAENGVDYEYHLHHRNIMSWAEELMMEPTLAPLFTWDARQTFQYNGSDWVRFWDEPTTGDFFWQAQTSLPLGGKPLAFLIYSDKTLLSSFGTVQGYPVIARILNLPVEVRNGRGLGGGQIIAWLPIVGKDQRVSDTVWAEHRRVVWHTAYKIVLEPIARNQAVGRFFKLPNTITIHSFPTVLILSEDYEEGAFMTLIRGVQGDFPCTVCLVPRSEQNNYDTIYPRRTSAGVQRLRAKAAKVTTKKAKNALFKAEGLRDLENSFWTLQRDDVFRAISFDRLHNNHDGLWGKHMLPHLIQLIEELEKRTKGIKKGVLIKLADLQLDVYPRWRNLEHFGEFMSKRFTDGKKYEHLSKELGFVVHNILTKEDDPDGYLFLKAIRSYNVVDMLASFDVLTEDHIAMGRKEVKTYSKLIRAYDTSVRAKATAEEIARMDAEEEAERLDVDSANVSDDDHGSPAREASGGRREAKVKPIKSWNFPKVHALSHLFDDVVAKGATRNYNTKPNEEMHHDTKVSYQQRTNFKNVDEQILQAEHWIGTADFIRKQVEVQDKLRASGRKLEDDGEEGDRVIDFTGNVTAHSSRGAGGGLFTISQIESRKKQDRAFTDFHSRLFVVLKSLMDDTPDLFPDGSRGLKHLNKALKVRLYGSLKVNYTSKVDWKTTTDYLKCSPCFYNHPRYDCVLVQGEDGLYFGRLVIVFECKIQTKSVICALVHPFTQRVTQTLRRLDKDLGFYRVKAIARKESVIIPVHSIVRGALMVPDLGLHPLPDYLFAESSSAKYVDDLAQIRKPKEYLVNDLVDGDWFLRMLKLDYIGKRAPLGPRRSRRHSRIAI